MIQFDWNAVKSSVIDAGIISYQNLIANYNTKYSFSPVVWIISYQNLIANYNLSTFK